jgi:hypothetical protein
MTNLDGVVAVLKREHARLTKQVEGISASLKAFGTAYGKQNGGRRTISAAGRARIAAAQRARWAKVKAKGETKNVIALPKKRTMSAAARKRIAQAQKKRWVALKAKQKAAK